MWIRNFIERATYSILNGTLSHLSENFQFWSLFISYFGIYQQKQKSKIYFFTREVLEINVVKHFFFYEHLIELRDGPSMVRFWVVFCLFFLGSKFSNVRKKYVDI